MSSDIGWLDCKGYPWCESNLEMVMETMVIVIKVLIVIVIVGVRGCDY